MAPPAAHLVQLVLLGCPALLVGLRSYEADLEAAVTEVHSQEVATVGADLQHFVDLLSRTESGIDSEWFWRSGCKFRWSKNRPTEKFHFQICGSGVCYSVRLTRDAENPMLKVWRDHEWHVQLDDSLAGGVRWTAVPRAGFEPANATEVHLFNDVTSIEYKEVFMDQILLLNGTDFEFVDGLYLEEHIVKLGLEVENSTGYDSGSDWHAVGRSVAASETRYQNFTRTGARLGLQVGQIVSPIAGISAVFAMTAAVGFAPAVMNAVLGTLAGIVGSSIAGYTVGGLVAGVSGIGQALGLVKQRIVQEKLGAEIKMWQELRCIRGYDVCSDRLPDPDDGFAAALSKVIVPKGIECYT